MVRSMTGFGSAEGPVAGGRLQVDIRTVNHRHLNIQLKVPYGLAEGEPQLREAVRSRIDRGHVTVSGRWVEEAPREAEVTVNVARAREVLSALNELSQSMDLEPVRDVTFLARLPDILVTVQPPATVPVWSEVAPVVEAALQAVLASRAREGQALGTEVHGRLGLIEAGLAGVEARAPERITAERDRLRAAVTTLTEGVTISEDRLAQEIAILADKLDVTEEAVRLRAHLAAAYEALDADEAVGKRLGFLNQEMLREVNTIGSKANDAPIAHAVIAMKGELEKIREQIENLE